jgi:predicted alpha/beta hydrolase family esterase
MLGKNKSSFLSTLLVTVIIQVILVGHSCGGASVSYALEHCPKKISKAVFLTATMVKDGQRPFDVFSEEVCNLSLYVTTSMCIFNENLP